MNVHLVESFIHVLAVEAEIKSRPMMFSDDSTDLMTLFDDSMLTETGTLQYLYYKRNIQVIFKACRAIDNLRRLAAKRNKMPSEKILKFSKN